MDAKVNGICDGSSWFPDDNRSGSGSGGGERAWGLPLWSIRLSEEPALVTPVAVGGAAAVNEGLGRREYLPSFLLGRRGTSRVASTATNGYARFGCQEQPVDGGDGDDGTCDSSTLGNEFFVFDKIGNRGDSSNYSHDGSNVSTQPPVGAVNEASGFWAAQTGKTQQDPSHGAAEKTVSETAEVAPQLQTTGACEVNP